MATIDEEVAAEGLRPCSEQFLSNKKMFFSCFDSLSSDIDCYSVVQCSSAVPCSLPVTIIEMSQLQKLRIQITAHSRLGTQHTHTPPHWFCCAACTSAWCCSAFAACWSSSMVHLFSAGGGEVNAARGSGTAAYAAASASASAALMGARLVSCHSFSARPMSEFISGRCAAQYHSQCGGGGGRMRR